MSGAALPPVLFEDDVLVAYDKPSGLLIAPDRWDKSRENLMDLVHRIASPDWFNVHRLDKDTSGVVLCAKNKAALDALCMAFETRAVTKTYLALTRGAPPAPSGRISLALAPDPARPGRVVARPTGKPAETLYAVVERWPGYALVRLHPATGRSHQLRVHLAALGCPIVADAFYGDGRGCFLSDLKRGYKPGRDAERPLLGRLGLHAHQLTFAHPVRGDEMTIEAPIPREFEITLKNLRKYAQ